MITELVGNRIKEICSEQGISQEKLALRAELDRTYIVGVESGKRNPSIKGLEKIINALDANFLDDDLGDLRKRNRNSDYSNVENEMF